MVFALAAEPFIASAKKLFLREGLQAIVNCRLILNFWALIALIILFVEVDLLVFGLFNAWQVNLSLWLPLNRELQLSRVLNFPQDLTDRDRFIIMEIK